VRVTAAEAIAFHRALPGYRPTPLHGVHPGVEIKDESTRFGLPSFKVLGASWAVERLLRERPDVHTLVAASAGNHGRAVAHVAARRGLACRILLPARASRARADAIRGEGAEVVVIDGDYDDAVAAAAADGAQPGVAELADVGDSGPAHWVIDGYATLFSELADQGHADLIVVPVGAGSLAAAAVRFGARYGIRIVGVEPATAACLTASLAAGEPVTVPTPGTTMAGLDCATVSSAAWPTLRDGIDGTVTVTDAEVHEAMRELARAGLAIGDCGAAPLVALRKLGLKTGERAVLIATEGPTDPEGYRRTIEGR
jgi:diaminopropionate ammonia-lyase